MFISIILILRRFLIMPLVLGEFADKRAIVPNLSLVDKPDLTKILKAEIFVHTDGQLRV